MTLEGEGQRCSCQVNVEVDLELSVDVERDLGDSLNLDLSCCWKLTSSFLPDLAERGKSWKRETCGKVYSDDTYTSLVLCCSSIAFYITSCGTVKSEYMLDLSTC